MNAKLEVLAELNGYEDSDEMLAEVFEDSVCPGICKVPTCTFVTEVEPDCDGGWCEECAANTVVSAMVLAGVI